MQFNFNYQQERTNNTSGGGGGARRPELFSPLPSKGRDKHTNKLVVPLSPVGQWKLFNPTQEVAAKYGLLYTGGTIGLAPDSAHFSMRFKVHAVDKFRRPDGTQGFSWVVCPKQMNNVMIRANYAPIFESDYCPLCAEGSSYWDQFNDRFEELGHDEDARKSLSTNRYKEIIESDRVLKKLRETAKSFSPVERFATSVFNHDKYTGTTAMEEGETLQMQTWLAPMTVYDGFCTLFDAGIEFFNFSEGVPIIAVMKDNRKGERFPQYTVNFTGEKFAYDEAWVQYFNNPETQVDPTEFIHLATPEEMKYYIGSSDYEGSQSRNHAAMPPQQPPQGPPPAQAAPPAAQPPQGPPSAQAAPQGPPPAQQAAPPAQPQAPVAPPMQQPAQPASPVPPAAPSPVPPPAARPAVPQVASPLPQTPQGPLPPANPPVAQPPAQAAPQGPPPAQQAAPPMQPQAPQGGPPQGPPPVTAPLPNRQPPAGAPGAALRPWGK